MVHNRIASSSRVLLQINKLSVSRPRSSSDSTVSYSHARLSLDHQRATEMDHLRKSQNVRMSEHWPALRTHYYVQWSSNLYANTNRHRDSCLNNYRRILRALYNLSMLEITISYHSLYRCLQGAWLLINIALFTYQYWNFQATDKFYYMRIRTRVCPLCFVLSQLWITQAHTANGIVCLFVTQPDCRKGVDYYTPESSCIVKGGAGPHF